MLTAFASDEYYVRIASSSIAASLNAASPLLGDARLLHSYTFLTDAAAIIHDVPAGSPWPDPARAGIDAAVTWLLSRNETAHSTASALADRPGPRHHDVTLQDALLIALDSKVTFYHEAAARLRRKIMHRNVQTAQQILQDTRAWAAL